MRHDLGRYAGLVLLLTLLVPLCLGAEETGEAVPAVAEANAAPAVLPAAVQPVAVRDPLYRLEFTLPAPYWKYTDNQALTAEAAKGAGGCRPPQQVPANLLFVFTHDDAPVLGRLELLERSFLVRNKAGLEGYVDARVAEIGKQAGGVMQGKAVSYTTDGGLITHRLEFTVPAGSGGGGCAPSGPGGPAVRYAVVHHFVRPEGADALLFVMYCWAPADLFEQLKPEIESIIGSFRYTGNVQAELFEPDAPEAKLLTPERAAKGKQGGFNWLLPVGLAMIIWMMLRRKKQKSE